MEILLIIVLFCALVVFVAATFNMVARVNLVALGFVLLTVVWLVEHVDAANLHLGK